MPQIQAKKRNSDRDTSAISQCDDSNSSIAAGTNAAINQSNGSSSSGKSRKRFGLLIFHEK